MFTFYKLYDFPSNNDNTQEETLAGSTNCNVSCSPDKVWVIPGHIFSYSNKGYNLRSVVTSDYTTGQYSGCDPDLTLQFQCPVVELCTVSLPNDNAVLIVTQIGDVHVWRYDIYELEWCKQFTFQLRSGNSETLLDAVIFHEQLEFAVWCEKHGCDAFENSIYVRKYSTTTPRTMSDFCLNDYISETILTHCPRVTFCTLGALVTMTFIMQNSPNIFMIWSRDSGLSMFDTKGVLLWTDNTSPYRRFAKILTCTLNNWETHSDNIAVGHASNRVHNRLYILVKNGNLLTLNSSGIIGTKTCIPLDRELDLLGFYVYSNFVFVFTISEVLIYNMKNGDCLGSLPLSNQTSLTGTWYHSSSVSLFGFYTNNYVYRMVLKDYLSILGSFDNASLSVGNADMDFLFKMNCLLNGKHVPNFEIAGMAIPTLQSKAMVLALVHHFGELTECGDENLNHKVIERLVNALPEAPNQKLKRLLRSLVECFLKLHYYSDRQSH